MDLNTPFGPLRLVRLHPDRVPLPAYATTGAAGLDLTADLDAPVALSPLERKLIPTGLVLELPPHTEAQLRPRSGLALRHGVTLVAGGQVRSVETGTSYSVGALSWWQRVWFHFGNRPLLLALLAVLAGLVVAALAYWMLRGVATSRVPRG